MATNKNLDRIQIYKLNNEIWLKGKQIANILDFKNPVNALMEYINKSHMRYAYEMQEIMKHDLNDLHPQTILINKEAALELISRSESSDEIKEQLMNKITSDNYERSNKFLN